MKKLKRFLAIIASVLTVSLFFGSESCQMIAYAVGEALVDSKLYMSEVKMFYGRTEAEAKTACEKEGFIFCPTNLNEGEATVSAGFWSSNVYKQIFEDVKMGTYIGYKTTDDPKKAITNLTILDMKYTHFEDMDYEKYLDEHLQDFKNEAAQMLLLVNELRRKKEAGSPNAIMAYDSLNLFYVDEKKSHDAESNRLGYYLINNADIAFFEKFIQCGNSMILSKITDLLCSAAADYNAEGKTWADKARESNADYDYENGTSDIRNMYDQNCQDTAKKFVKYVSEFSSTYSQAKARFDKYGETLGYSELEGMTLENGSEKINSAGADCRFPEFSEALKNYALLDASYLHKKG